MFGPIGFFLREFPFATIFLFFPSGGGGSHPLESPVGGVPQKGTPPPADVPTTSTSVALPRQTIKGKHQHDIKSAVYFSHSNNLRPSHQRNTTSPDRPGPTPVGYLSAQISNVAFFSTELNCHIVKSNSKYVSTSNYNDLVPPFSQPSSVLSPISHIIFETMMFHRVFFPSCVADLSTPDLLGFLNAFFFTCGFDNRVKSALVTNMVTNREGTPQFSATDSSIRTKIWRTCNKKLSIVLNKFLFQLKMVAKKSHILSLTTTDSVLLLALDTYLLERYAAEAIALSGRSPGSRHTRSVI